MEYYVSIGYYASFNVKVEADSKEEALDKAYDESPPSLCHHCSTNLEVGEVIENSELIEEA